MSFNSSGRDWNPKFSNMYVINKYKIKNSYAIKWWNKYECSIWIQRQIVSGSGINSTHLNLIVSKAELAQLNTRLEWSANTLKLAIREGKLKPGERYHDNRNRILKLCTKRAQNLGAPFTFVIDFTFIRASPISQIGFLDRTAEVRHTSRLFKVFGSWYIYVHFFVHIQVQIIVRSHLARNNYAFQTYNRQSKTTGLSMM